MLIISNDVNNLELSNKNNFKFLVNIHFSLKFNGKNWGLLKSPSSSKWINWKWYANSIEIIKVTSLLQIPYSSYLA
jgi:hypothetical protein